jgi:hypothetical protein
MGGLGETHGVGGVRASRTARFTRALLIALIVSLSASAVLAVWAVLVGDFGDLEVRILFTTLAFGLFSLAGLGAALRFDRHRFVAVGVGGVAASALALVMSLVAIWGEELWDNETFVRLLGTSIVLAVSFGYVSLMLLVRPRHAGVSLALAATVGLATLIAAILIWMIWGDFGPESGMFRLLVSLGILATLGTLVTPILNRVLGQNR